MSKTLIIAPAMLVLLASSSGAADLDSVSEAHDWSGFYVGGHLATGLANYAGTFDEGIDTDMFPADLDLSGVASGVHAGWNRQMNDFVLGVEADWTFTDWEDSIGPNNMKETIAGDIGWLASLRARGGIALDSVLLYATAGAALADADYTVSDDLAENGPPFEGSLSFDSLGLVAGGGAEWALKDNWSVRAEGLYFAMNDKTSAGDLIGDQDSFDDEVEFEDAWMVRAGVSFRFGPEG